MNFISTLLEAASDFATNVLPFFRYIFLFIVILCAILIFVTLLMQSNDSSEGMDVISGSQESYYAQNKGSSRDGKLKIITIVMASILLVCAILYFVTLFFSGRS